MVGTQSDFSPPFSKRKCPLSLRIILSCLQGIFFRTDGDGSAITQGQYGQQASHAKSGYHTHENAFLSFLYNMTYVGKKDFTLYFKPDADCGLDQLNVLPDFLEPDVIKVRKVHNLLIATVEASSDVKRSQSDMLYLSRQVAQKMDMYRTIFRNKLSCSPKDRVNGVWLRKRA